MKTKKTATKKDTAPESISRDVFTSAGKKAGTISLPGDVFGLKWNASLIHQVVTSMEANARTPVAHVKTRGEVRGGGKKPWKQKGTGRARHGSSRSPIWVGGGVTHGPRNEKDYSKKVNKKMRSKALAIALSKKINDEEVLFVDALNFSVPKTKDAKGALGALAHIKGFETLNRRKNAALITVPALTPAIVKSFRNFGNVLVRDVASINPVEVLTYKHVICIEPEASVEALTKRILSSK